VDISIFLDFVTYFTTTEDYETSNGEKICEEYVGKDLARSNHETIKSCLGF
jgi:hypothetical protein